MLLHVLEDFLRLRGFGYERLDGTITGDKRQNAIDRFCANDSKAFVFLLGTRAGGVGINLTAADTVIMHDIDWNPQNDIQAMARCHRIGQTKPVQVYKLCTKGTYETAMLQNSNQKLGLEHAVMRQGDHGEKALTATGFGRQEKPDEATAKQKGEQIEALLRSGAQLLGLDDTETQKHKSIEEILAHDSETRTFGADEAAAPEGAAAAAGSSSGARAAAGGGSLFSHASATTEGGKTLDLDDPSFWAKMLPDRPDVAAAADAQAAEKKKEKKEADVKKKKAEEAMRCLEKTAPKDFEKTLPAERPRPDSYSKAPPKHRPPPPERLPAAPKPRAPPKSHKRQEMAPFSAAEAEAVERLLLAYGHRRAPAGTNPRYEGDLDGRDPKFVRRACDGVLLSWLAAASPAERAAYLRQPLRLHTDPAHPIDGAKGKAAAAARVQKPHNGEKEAVAAAGGTPRPRGRAPRNAAGVTLEWSHTRGKWVEPDDDCLNAEAAAFHARLEAARAAAAGEPGAAAAASSSAAPEADDDDDDDSAEADAERRQLVATAEAKAGFAVEGGAAAAWAARVAERAGPSLRTLAALRALDDALARDKTLGAWEPPPALADGAFDAKGDRALLRGVAKHGVGRWMAMWRDGALALAPAEAVAARQAREARYGEDDDEEAEEAEGEGEYVVERLLDERRSAAVHGGKCEFLVKWKSYGDETWEPEEHVDDCGPYDDWVKERKEAADALAERAEALLAGLA